MWTAVLHGRRANSSAATGAEELLWILLTPRLRQRAFGIILPSPRTTLSTIRSLNCISRVAPREQSPTLGVRASKTMWDRSGFQFTVPGTVNSHTIGIGLVTVGVYLDMKYFNSDVWREFSGSLCRGDTEMMIYITYGIGLAAISAGATAVWAGLRYFLAQRSGGDMTSGMHILNLALIGASARVLIGVQFLLVAEYRGFGPEDGANLWPGIA